MSVKGSIGWSRLAIGTLDLSSKEIRCPAHDGDQRCNAALYKDQWRPLDPHFVDTSMDHSHLVFTSHKAVTDCPNPNGLRSHHVFISRIGDSKNPKLYGNLYIEAVIDQEFEECMESMAGELQEATP